MTSTDRLAPAPSSATFASPRTLEELVGAVARGDEESFSELYDRVSPPVYGLVRRVLRDPAQSQEVAQEVLVQVWSTAGRFDPDRARALSWILLLAHRRAIDRVRSEQAARDRNVRAGRRDRERPFDVVVEEVERRLEHERVHTCLDRLTDLQREAIELAYFHGHSYREVAELLGTPHGTIKTRIRDGLQHLRSLLDPPSATRTSA